MNLENLKYDEKGLIPAIVQDFYTSEVLMLAYMNAESLSITLEEGTTCFYSRSRQELWRKGATSGNRQHVVKIQSDCDNDTLLLQVIKEGPACHTGAVSCFFNLIFQKNVSPAFSLQTLYTMLQERKTNPKEGSYTSYLYEKGMEKILKKVGEESTEVVIAGMKQDNQELVFELSDLCYHLFVLMIQSGITLEQVKEELASRHVIDKKVKQETLQ